MKWIAERNADTVAEPEGPKEQADLYPAPPSADWCESYPAPDADLITHLELTLHHEAQPARRRAIIQKFLDDYATRVEPEQALDEIAVLAGCPTWDYPGQVVRDVQNIVDAIKAHHAARGHDRCWENDANLYRAAGLVVGDEGLPPRDEFRAKCREYEAERYKDQTEKTS